MFHVDVPKVRGKMAERGYTIGSLSEAVGVNRNTLSGYLENPEKMPYNIVVAMAELLCDTTDEASGVFFCQ